MSAALPSPLRSTRPPRRRASTETSMFGSSRREAHDSTAFYRRFALPDLSDDNELGTSRLVDEIFQHDARDMYHVADSSVALVVTSPPYFAGKEYETALGEGHVPATYAAYLAMIEDVFAECVRKLEPGGRIAVNVANLGRKPYRSLSGDVAFILQDRLRLLLRGEVIWIKARGAAGSCAWGSFQSPANPVLRDLSERIIIASKGRFDRALSRRERFSRRLPSEASIFRDEFMEATTDIWEIPPESATRVGHPAPFPVELPERLIHLYTYRDDVVLDPFIGSGTTAIAALRTQRHYLGYDLEPTYVKQARVRVSREKETLQALQESESEPRRVVLSSGPPPASGNEDFQARAVREGRAARDLAREALEQCGFSHIQANVKLPQGVEVNFAALDNTGGQWLFDVSGGFTSNRPGLRRTDTLWKALGKAAVIHEAYPASRLVLLTTDAPPRGSAGHSALSVLVGRGKPIHDTIVLSSPNDLLTLRSYARDQRERSTL
ncbi:MAG: DNA-methyltransferase [Acidimicrobiales bacterium]